MLSIRRHTFFQGEWSYCVFFFFSSRRRHTRLQGDWSSDVCSSDLHNLATDPPFSKMDLIVCRNVLIYLELELQRRVSSIFHYALTTPGFLMLGVSETIGPLSDLFSVVDKKYKVYAKRPTSRRFDLGLGSLDRRTAKTATGRTARSTGEAGGGRSDLLQQVDRILLSKYAPAGVLVNEAAEILQFRGHTSPYLEPAPRQASLNLLKMAREGLLMELRVAIDKARKQNAPVRRERLSIKQDGRMAQVTLQVIPMSGPARERNYLVLFERVPPSRETSVPGRRIPSAIAHPRRHIENLRQELTATKEFLQSIIEEREAANQELQAANEELLSSNEELQSTNEELETAKEELQSVNEELTTVNEELQHRNVELSQLNNDLNNLFAGVDIPIVILGSDARIRRFTPMAAKVLNLIPADLGRPIGDIRPNLDLSDLEQAPSTRTRAPPGSWHRPSAVRAWRFWLDDRITRLESLRYSLRSSLGPPTEHARGAFMSLARVARDGETRSGLSRPGAQLPSRVPAKTDRTSSWQFGRLPGALRAPGSLSARGEPRVEVEPHAGPSAVRGPERLRANPALRGTRARPARDPGLR